MAQAGKSSTSLPEVWKEAAGFPNYAVSSYGRVMRTKTITSAKAGSILKPTLHYRGYFHHGLGRDGKTISTRLNRLVCSTFHGPAPSPAHEAAHIDGDRHNNKADNLKWATKLQNESDKDRHGKRRRGSAIPWAKLNEEQVLDIRRRVVSGHVVSVDSLAQEFKVPVGLLRQVIAGRSWKHLL